MSKHYGTGKRMTVRTKAVKLEIVKSKTAGAQPSTSKRPQKY